MKNDETYRDLIERAAKVRHFLAKNPGSTHADILAEFFPMKIPLMFLITRCYIKRVKNPNPLGGPPVYYCKPMGVPKFPEEEYEESNSIAPETLGDSGESDI